MGLLSPISAFVIQFNREQRAKGSSSCWYFVCVFGWRTSKEINTELNIDLHLFGVYSRHSSTTYLFVSLLFIPGYSSNGLSSVGVGGKTTTIDPHSHLRQPGNNNNQIIVITLIKRNWISTSSCNQVITLPSAQPWPLVIIESVDLELAT